ncbi:MAG: hypothetical protein K2J49_08710, partial [Muribaculaceae bacterium]|nr:hypothetical protein [Muribaculaceae bacterium]
MKLNIQQTDMEPIRKLLTYTDSDQVIAVSDEDVDNLFDSATNLSLHTSGGDNLKDALQKLNTQELDCGKAIKAIFVVRCLQSYQLSVSELADLSQYINDNLPQADVRWGFSVKNESEANVTVI